MNQIEPNTFKKIYGPIRKKWLMFHLADERYKFMFDSPPPNEWIVLDCETTGLSVTKDEIISIGAVKIVGNTLMTSERLELLVKPEKKISPESV